MTTWGISANSHNAALAVFNNDSLKFASHSERFSRIKNDPDLHDATSDGLITYAWNEYGAPDQVVWYERPFKKTMRQLFAGQGWNYKENNIKTYLEKYNIRPPEGLHYVDHHHSHAAGGYFTSGFDQAMVLVIDSIGEFETLSIWKGSGNALKRAYSQGYPHSVGLWYSAMTQRIGLKPNEDEYILMGMAAYGDSNRLVNDIRKDFIAAWPNANIPSIKFKQNLHTGCKDWRPDLTSQQDIFDIAAATQRVYEEILEYIIQYISINDDCPNLVIMGGCALNCSANSIATKYYKNIWIMPDPGDSGSAIGAVLAHKHVQIGWKTSYLGYDIKQAYPVESALAELINTGIVGVANGKAEMGPRALGNRSLLADPRGIDIKFKVNEIKQRQQFRPFAPAILTEHAGSIFDGAVGPFMQYTARCKYPELYPAIVHADGTSRVQTVSEGDNPGFRKLLERWYAETGCPMLLNTSLNIKGQPMVNTVADGQEFSKKYNVNVY